MGDEPKQLRCTDAMFSASGDLVIERARGTGLVLPFCGVVSRCVVSCVISNHLGLMQVERSWAAKWVLLGSFSLHPRGAQSSQGLLKASRLLSLLTVSRPS